jgi:hypothetical protein
MTTTIRALRSAAMALGFLALTAGGAHATGTFGAESLHGAYVISADGGFVAMTPFSPDPLRLNVAMVGRLTFDAAGQAHGEWTISFHHASVPFGVVSRFETVGTYSVAASGRTIMEFEEFKIEPPADDDGMADGIVGFECYIVQRRAEARCILNVLVSLQQGPNPVPQPVTMLGTLLRQR